MPQLFDGTTTCLASDWRELAELVSEDGDFDFSQLYPSEVQSLFEVGRWWEKNRPGITRLEQQVRDGAADYFTYTDSRKLAKTVSWYAVPLMNLRKEPLDRQDVPLEICFVSRGDHKTLLGACIAEHERFGKRMERLPSGVATQKNIKELYDELRSSTFSKVVFDRCRDERTSCYYLRGWPGSCLVSHGGNVNADGRAMHLHDVSIGDKYVRLPEEMSIFIRPRAGEQLLLLCDLYPKHARNPILLLPELREVASWSECIDEHDRVTSSFLVASPDLLKYMDHGRPKWT